MIHYAIVFFTMAAIAAIFSCAGLGSIFAPLMLLFMALSFASLISGVMSNKVKIAAFFSSLSAALQRQPLMHS